MSLPIDERPSVRIDLLDHKLLRRELEAETLQVCLLKPHETNTRRECVRLEKPLRYGSVQAVQDYGHGLKISYVEDNVQLLLSTLMCVLMLFCINLSYKFLIFAYRIVCVRCRVICGAAAHLLPGKFKDHQEELKICVIVYYALVGVTFLFSWFVTKENFMVVCSSPKHHIPRLGISLKMPRFATNFTLKFTSKDRTYITPSMSVEKFFHEDGFVARPSFHNWVNDQLKAFAEKSAAHANAKKSDQME